MATATMMDAASHTRPELSSHDLAIISALFDPESSASSAVPISTSLPDLHGFPSTVFRDLRLRETEAVHRLNVPEPSPAVIADAIVSLSCLIEDQPTYAPAFLNRAQASRLLLTSNSPDTESARIFTSANLASTTRILSDLGTVITLTTPPTPSESLSRFQADLLAKAHTHRGYALLQAASASEIEGCVLPKTLASLEKSQLEEMANRDFFLGGRYGNRLARQLSVQTNPYAKMCGAIVKEAIRKEREEYTSRVDATIDSC